MYVILIRILLLHIDPLAPVNALVVNTTSTTIFVAWEPPLMPNGIVLGYNVTYRGLATPNAVGPTFAEGMIIAVMNTSVELSSLSPGSNYSIRVTAFTTVGEGPPSEDVRTATNEDSKLCFLSRGPHITCCTELNLKGRG